MGKQRNTYRSFTTSQLKTRSEIPSQTDITEGTGYIDCVNISLNAVKGVLSAGTYSLYDICRHANVNHWSGFGPTVRTTTGSGYNKVLVNSDPTACSLGSFAGYNHGATTPGWQTDGEADAEANNWVNVNSKATCEADIHIGEVEYHLDLGVHNVVMIVFDGTGARVGWDQVELSSIPDHGNITMSAETDSNITTDHATTTLNVSGSPSRSGTTVTVNTSTDHGLATGAMVQMDGWSVAAYNGLFSITKTSDTQFTYTTTSGSDTASGGTAKNGWYARVFLTATYPLAGHEDVESDVVCEMPNVSYFQINIKAKQLSTIYFNGTQTSNGAGSCTAGGYTISNVVFNASTGVCGFGELQGGSTGIDGLQVHVQVLDWLDAEVSAGNIYDDTDGGGPATGYGYYQQNDLLTSYDDPIDTYDAGALDYSYGYKFYITTLEHS